VSADLAGIVARARYKPGWEFFLTQGPTFAASRPELVLAGTGLGMSASYGNCAAIPDGLPLYVQVRMSTPDSANPARRISITHTIPAPPLPRQMTGFDWQQWFFEHVIMAIERHEAGEFFDLAGWRPFYPAHGPGEDPYRLTRREQPPVPGRCRYCEAPANRDGSCSRSCVGVGDG